MTLCATSGSLCNCGFLEPRGTCADVPEVGVFVTVFGDVSLCRVTYSFHNSSIGVADFIRGRIVFITRLLVLSRMPVN